jgi:TM2 domain-containing membrane protein YozV
MAARTFGRKGEIGKPAQRRAGLVAHAPRSFRPAAPEDDAEARRAAFLSEERARDAEPAGPSAVESVLRAVKAMRAAAPEAIPTDRSLKAAWPIWFLLGLAGGHRFYLRRPISGALQALLFLGCLGAVVVAQRYEAFFGLAFSWVWMLADGIRLRRMFMTAGRQ